MNTTLFTIYLNMMKAIITLIITTTKALYNAVKPIITIPSDSSIMDNVMKNEKELDAIFQEYNGRLLNLLSSIEQKVKDELTVKEVIVKRQ